MDNIELLDNAIKACEDLKNLRYNIIIAKNGKEVPIRLLFLKSDFSHLLGFHKLKYVLKVLSNSSSERRYEIVKTNKNGIRQTIANSKQFDLIVPRLNAIINLETILDSNNEQYYERPNHLGDSRINYDYIFKYHDNVFTFSFIVEDKKKNPSRYVIKSIFEDKKDDYTFGRRPYVLIYKEKIRYKEGTKEVLLENTLYNK